MSCKAELRVHFSDGSILVIEELNIECSGGRLPKYKSYSSINELHADLCLYSPKDLLGQHPSSIRDFLEKAGTFSGLISLLLHHNTRRDYVQIEIRRVKAKDGNLLKQIKNLLLA